jgi:hypothetical protein
MNRNIFRFAWLLSLLVGASLACNLITGIGQGVKDVQSIVTQAQGIATQSAPLMATAQAFATQEGGGLLKTAQAIATDNPGILETAQAAGGDLLKTAQAVATDNPGFLETAQAAVTNYNPGENAQVPEDIPVVDQTTIQNQTSVNGVLTYTTSLDFKTVLDFYTKEMPNNGWEYDQSTSVQSGNNALLNYKKDDRTASIVITENTAEINVGVVIKY